MRTCTHCNEPITSGDTAGTEAWQWIHVGPGGYNGKRRCDPEKSGLMYGYEAHPGDVDCSTCPGSPGA